MFYPNKLGYVRMDKLFGLGRVGGHMGGSGVTKISVCLSRNQVSGRANLYASFAMNRAVSGKLKYYII